MSCWKKKNSLQLQFLIGPYIAGFIASRYITDYCHLQPIISNILATTKREIKLFFILIGKKTLNIGKALQTSDPEN